MTKRLAMLALPLLALTACSSGSGDAAKSPDEITVKGTVTLGGTVGDTDTSDIMDIDTSYSPRGVEAKDNDRCAGQHGYDDISPNAQVTIVDESDKTLGLGNLGVGRLTATDHDCRFEFEVPKVPTTAKFYKVKIGHRDGPQYTLDDIKSGPNLTIG